MEPSRLPWTQQAGDLRRQILDAIHADAIVPKALRSRLEGRLKTAGMEDYLPTGRLYHEDQPLDEAVNFLPLWEMVRQLFVGASEAEGMYEAHWIRNVVAPALEYVAKPYYTASDGDDDDDDDDDAKRDAGKSEILVSEM